MYLHHHSVAMRRQHESGRSTMIPPEINPPYVAAMPNATAPADGFPGLI